MNAAIDIGNTKVKLGLFEGENLISFQDFQHLEDLSTNLREKEINNIIISSVKESPEEITKKLQLNNIPIFLDINTPIPFENLYKSETLGLDRIAVTAAVSVLYPDQNTLVIDLGTCITYDFLEQGKSYYGGAISPGVHMRYRSLHNFTARLPLITTIQPIDFIGTTTEESIQSGVIHGISGEIDAFINFYREKYNPLNVIITGGDTKYFESKIKATIFAIPELVLVGLNAILRHNASI